MCIRDRIIPGDCPCGRKHRRIDRILGRSDDMIIVKGVNIYPMQVERVLMAYPEERCRRDSDPALLTGFFLPHDQRYWGYLIGIGIMGLLAYMQHARTTQTTEAAA